MTGWTTFCGACGAPMCDCPRPAAPCADMTDAQSMVNVPPPVLPPPPPRFRIRYGVVYCEVCGFATPCWKGHAPEAAPAQDGDSSGLHRRIAEIVDARTKAGGR